MRYCRLGEYKLKSFELRKPLCPPMEWAKIPVYECAYIKDPHEPDMFYYQRWVLTRHENIKHLRRSKEDLEFEVREPWNEVMRDLDLSPTPDLYLLGHTPGGTLFPWYLIQGLYGLRKEADNTGFNGYDEEYETAKTQKAETIDRWEEKNPHTTLEYF